MQPTKPQTLSKNLVFHAVNSFPANSTPSMTSSRKGKELNNLRMMRFDGGLLLNQVLSSLCFFPLDHSLYAKIGELDVDHDCDTQNRDYIFGLSRNEFCAVLVSLSLNPKSFGDNISLYNSLPAVFFFDLLVLSI